MLKDSDIVPSGFYLGITKEIPKHWLITNGTENKYLYENESIPEGWRLGSTIDLKKKAWITDGVTNQRWDMNEELPNGWRTGKTVIGFFVTNDKEAKLVSSESEIPEGWRRGRIKRTRAQILKDNLTI